jgi:hypothetical protein
MKEPTLHEEIISVSMILFDSFIGQILWEDFGAAGFDFQSWFIMGPTISSY